MLYPRTGAVYIQHMPRPRLYDRVVRTSDPRMFGHVRETGNGGDGAFRWTLKRTPITNDEPPEILDSGTEHRADAAFSALYRSVMATGHSAV